MRNCLCTEVAPLTEDGQGRPDLDKERGLATEVEAKQDLWRAHANSIIGQAYDRVPIQLRQAPIDLVAGGELVSWNR